MGHTPSARCTNSSAGARSNSTQAHWVNENDSTIRKAYTFAARGRHPAPTTEDGMAAAVAQDLRGGCSLNLAIVWCYLMVALGAAPSGGDAPLQTQERNP